MTNPPKPAVTTEADPFIPYVESEDFDPSIKPILDPYMERMGFLPNALKLYAHRPEIAVTLFTLRTGSARVSLTRATGSDLGITCAASINCRV